MHRRETARIGQHRPEVFVHQGGHGFIQPVVDVIHNVITIFRVEHHLRIGGINAGQDVFGTERLQHRAQRVVQSQHMVGTTAGGQGQHHFAFQRRLRQQI